MHQKPPDPLGELKGWARGKGRKRGEWGKKGEEGKWKEEGKGKEREENERGGKFFPPLK